MSNYDWLIIGGGITGSALAYELVKQGFRVLLLEKDSHPTNASYYSYGGLAYWSGTTPFTRQLCQEGIALHRHLPQELDADTEFRDIDLLLTINGDDNPDTIAAQYQNFAITPRLLTVQEACQLEPLLNPEAISGVLQLPHAHINVAKTVSAYQQAFLRLGGEIRIEQVINLLKQGNQVTGVATTQQNYLAANTVVCAGGLTRYLLEEQGIKAKIYFTHAQLIKTPPVSFKLNSLIMPAILQRFALEAQTSQSEAIWDEENQQQIGAILDPGAIQFLDGSLCIGQISQVIPDPQPNLDLAECERKIRRRVAIILPSLNNIPGTVHTCLVPFTNNPYPLVGPIDNWQGIHLFSGFGNTLVFTPILARRFAQTWV